ncbi:MAG TPA: cation diffusion facilitator family transporter [Pyrinomonadaceae bacterium]|nr:cation diffusion facilitator family transporter [Pyrinomonadaceae bacterium]
MENISATNQNRRGLLITFALTFSYFLVEVVGGILTNSLALLADAAHMLTDVFGLGLALFAIWIAQKPATPEKTYGYYRFEILAALANAVVLFFISFYILYEAYYRFRSPPEVASLPMIMIAVVGLGVNLAGMWILRSGAKESLNVQGAFLEVVSDALGSVGVIIAGIIMLATGWYYADPIFSVAIGLFILPRTWKLLTQAVNVLLEGTPAHINLAAVEEMMLEVDGVEKVHDLHVWTITSGIEALSTHIVLADNCDPNNADRVLEQLTALLKEKFGIDHSTIQIEKSSRHEKEMQH